MIIVVIIIIIIITIIVIILQLPLLGLVRQPRLLRLPLPRLHRLVPKPLLFGRLGPVRGGLRQPLLLNLHPLLRPSGLLQLHGLLLPHAPHRQLCGPPSPKPGRAACLGLRAVLKL